MRRLSATDLLGYQDIRPETPETIELGDLLVNYLAQLGVEYVFGIPGGAIEPLFDALARSQRRNGPRIIVSRHETGAAFMADGYSNSTGKLGVCCATTGPGATNLVTGVASAYANNIPMLVVTAQTALSTFGKGAFQDSSCTGVNTVSLFDSITRYSSLISHPEQFERKLATAIMKAFQAPSGPVHLSIPIDVFRHSVTSANPRFDMAGLVSKHALLDHDAVEKLYFALVNAKRPVFLIGDAAGDAIGSILSLAVKLNAPITTTPHGKGLVSPYHPLYYGVVGFAGHQSANELLTSEDVDVVVAIGSTLGEWATNGCGEYNILNERLIHVESSESNLTGSPMARLHVRGSLETIFEYLLDHLETETNSSKIQVNYGFSDIQSTSEGFSPHLVLNDVSAFNDDREPIKPQRLMKELAELFPPHTHYFADTGTSFAWATHYLLPHDRRISGKRNARGGVFRACLEFASMGWAIGCSVGAALARPGEATVCITGDGSMLMSGQEITVALQHRLPVIFVVLNDSAYGMVMHGQKLTGAEQIGIALPTIDFAAVARGMGIKGFVIRAVDDLRALQINELLNHSGPTLLDVRIDTNEIPPISVRTSSIKHFR